MEVVSYGEAKKQNLRHYFNGKECLNGHTSQWLVASGTCVVCKEEKRKIKTRQFTEEQKDSKREAVKKYRATEAGREVTRKSSIAWQNKQLSTDAFFKAKERIRLLLLASFRHGSYSKSSRTHEILGVSFEVMLAHLGCPDGIPEGYELDHIIPMALAFDEASAIRLNHFTNFQLLTKADNLAKRDNLPCGAKASTLSLEEKKAMIKELTL